MDHTRTATQGPAALHVHPSRAAVMAQLHTHLAAAAECGRAVFLQARPGSGVEQVASDFLRDARSADQHLQTARGDAADAHTPAWHQIALRLTRTQRTGAALRRSVWEWIGVLPYVGNLISAIVSTIAELREPAPQEEAALGTGSSTDDVRWLLVHGRMKRRLIVLENLDAADAAELSGAFALIQRLRTMRTMLLVTATMDAAHPAAVVTNLLREAERLGVGYSIHLPPLSPAEALAALEEATQVQVPDDWRTRLLPLLPATPVELDTLLANLIANGSITRTRRGWGWAPVSSLSDVELGLTPPLPTGVTAAQTDLLRCAAALGPRFAPADVARALGRSLSEVEDELGRLSRERLVTLCETVERDGEFIDIYELAIRSA